MIVTETVTINGKRFERTYSDALCKIERDGALYDEAVDHLGSGRVYTETNIPTEADETEATEGDYLEALERFGVNDES